MRSFLKVSVALLLLPALVHGQTRTKKAEVSTRKTMAQEALRTREGDVFAGLRTLNIVSVNDAGNQKTTEFAPSGHDLEQAVRDSILDRFRAGGLDDSAKQAPGLPGTIKIGINAFLSQTGDVIYSIRLALERPVCIMGTTEVVNAVVRQSTMVGRIAKYDAKEAILTGAKGLAAQLADEYMSRAGKLIEKGSGKTNRPGLTIIKN